MATLKRYAFSVMGLPVDEQHLLCDDRTSNGRLMRDGQSLHSYDIQDGDTINQVLRLRGGGCMPFADVSNSGEPASNAAVCHAASLSSVWRFHINCQHQWQLITL